MSRVVLLTCLLSSVISIHYVKGFEISDYPDFDNEEEEGSMVIVPDRLDYLYKKRMKDIEFFGVFLVVTGIPILWVLSTLFFASSSKEQMKSQSFSTGWSAPPMVVEMEKEMPEEKDIEIISEKIAITKDVIRLASQSLNLVSHTVDLFNILTGRGSGGGEGDDGGGGSDDRLKGKGEVGRKGQLPEKTSTVQFLSKALRLSTSTLAFIREILRY